MVLTVVRQALHIVLNTFGFEDAINLIEYFKYGTEL